MNSMNCKLEKFWNIKTRDLPPSISVWTVNLKSFEMTPTVIVGTGTINMNCKLEKFWNTTALKIPLIIVPMNCKLEKFWN